MKKNLISVLVLALVVVNLILTAILTISILPETKKANALITQVAAAIDLEVNGVKSESGESGNTVSIENIATYDVAAGGTMTINLKKSDDGKNHYAVIAVSISMDTQNEDYKKYGETVAEKESLIKSQINTIVSQYTYDEFTANQKEIQDAILKSLQTMFESDFIISVQFPSAIAE